ncbi:hypothetical protein AURDEDRAFT_187495 [Auricularia subglabra TFB-10046 SS5]|nr:hypothetical protein AURDEDRAFT_187495 [Auricularia subglabra TFB-10046 SS5]
MLLLSAVPLVSMLLSASAAVAPAPGALNIDTPTPENAGYKVYVKVHQGRPIHPVPRALHQGQPMQSVKGNHPPIPRILHHGQPMRPVEEGPKPTVPRKASRLLHHGQPMRPVEPDAHPVESSRRAPQEGAIYVASASTGEFIGFVANDYVANNRQRSGITTDIEKALTVDPTILAKVSPGPLATTNSPDKHTRLGFVTGPASAGNSLAQGSRSYALLTGADFCALPPRWRGAHHLLIRAVYLAAPGASPSPIGNAYGSGDVESAIWKLNVGTHALTAVWVNADDSIADATLVYLPQDNALALTGDVEEFSKSFGDAIPASLTLV